MTENTETTPQQDVGNTPASTLNPVTRKIVERCIQEVLTEYVQQTKQFTADSMHYIRVKVTDLVKQRLGDEEVVSVDVGLDLTTLADIPFFFKINIPKEKAEDHLMNAGDNAAEAKTT